MIERSTFAILVLSADDTSVEKSYRARQNVIHEVGLFQGRLGFSRAILLIETKTEKFSNMDGTQTISYRKGKIRETFGDVLATINREFPR